MNPAIGVAAPQVRQAECQAGAPAAPAWGEHDISAPNARLYTDPEALQSAMRGFDTIVTPVVPGRYQGFHSYRQAGDIGLQMGRVQQPLIARLEHTANEIILGFCPFGTWGQRLDGVRLANDIIAVSVPGSEAFFRKDAGEYWANLALPRDRLAAVLAMLCGQDLPTTLTFLRPGPAALQKLQRLFGIAMGLPGLAGRQGVTALLPPSEADFLEAAALCIADSTALPDTQTVQRQRIVMSRFREVLDRADFQPMRLRELCSATGIQVRSFRLYCQGALGMGAIRYLRLSRLMKARADLRSGVETSVTDVAMRHGFWELGRFAGDYAALFGELPSVTLADARRRCA